MPSLGPAEILVILVVALLVFGPDKMPEIARQVGRGYREFKRVQQHLKSELRDVVSEFDQETGTPTPQPTGDPVPMLPPRDDTPSPAVTLEAPPATPAAMPPAEVALPPQPAPSPPAPPAAVDPPADV